MYIVRTVTVYNPVIDTLPKEFRSVLTKQDQAAIKGGPEYFAGLAKSDSPKWLRKLLAECSENGFELQFYSAGDAPYRPYYRFEWRGMPAISLPRPGRLRSDLPEFLRHLYGVIGDFRENGFEMAGGLHAGDQLGPVSESGHWVEPGGPIDPKTAIAFLETFSGNQLCYFPDGRGAWLEANKFRRVRSLEKEVERYFEALLEGKRV